MSWQLQMDTWGNVKPISYRIFCTTPNDSQPWLKTWLTSTAGTLVYMWTSDPKLAFNFSSMAATDAHMARIKVRYATDGFKLVEKF